MDKQFNRIKEVMGPQGVKQTWLVEQIGKSFSIQKFLCLQLKKVEYRNFI